MNIKVKTSQLLAPIICEIDQNFSCNLKNQEPKSKKQNHHICHIFSALITLT